MQFKNGRLDHSLEAVFNLLVYCDKKKIMSALLKQCGQENPIHTNQESQQITSSIIKTNCMTPLDDPQYLFQNAQCFQHERELSSQSPKKKTKKNADFKFTYQFLYGCFMPPCYSVLNSRLMTKLVNYQKMSNPPKKFFEVYKEIIEHEQELFSKWLSTIWEEHLKNRRLDVIPHVENYIKSVYDFSNSYIRLQYSGNYRFKMKIDYNREEDEVNNNFEMTHCQRIKTSELKNTVDFNKVKKIDITDVNSKISFTDDVYYPPLKTPFIKDEICQTLSREHCSDVNICLSSLKRIMHLEKPNSLWIIPVNIDIGNDNRKIINIGEVSPQGYFSQQDKSLYYLRKEIKRKFRKPQSLSVQNNSQYNYDQWTLKANTTNCEINKSFNLIVRNKPHTKVPSKHGCENMETILIPKVEYQPEFGFEKFSENQLCEYWLDTYLRNPKTNFITFSVQYNMDIMMFKHQHIKSNELISENKKRMFFQRLCITLDKINQLDKGEYIMLHNPKKPFQVEIYQSSMYGGFNLLNMYFVLQQTEVSNSLTWNQIDSTIICPIHEYFKVAPCMFRPNPTLLNINTITEQVNKFKAFKEAQEMAEKKRIANRNFKKREKNKEKQKLKKQNDELFQMKQKLLNN